MLCKIYIKSSGRESSGGKLDCCDLCLRKEELNERKKRMRDDFYPGNTAEASPRQAQCFYEITDPGMSVPGKKNKRERIEARTKEVEITFTSKGKRECRPALSLCCTGASVHFSKPLLQHNVESEGRKPFEFVPKEKYPCVAELPSGYQTLFQLLAM